MARFYGLLLCAGMLITVQTGWALQSSAPSGTVDHARSAAHLTVSKISPEITTLTVESPEVTVNDTVADYHSYKLLGIAGEAIRPEEGHPSVPQITRFCRIPNTGSAELVLNDAEYDVVDDMEVFPFQNDSGAFGRLAKDELMYTKDEWYPANIASLSDPMIMRDFRVVLVTLNPVQVNPVTHQARIYRHLSADVVANDTPGINEIDYHRRPSGAWAPIYRNMIANLDDGALDDMTTTPGSILIITNSNATPLQWADSLAEWKTRAGYRTVIYSRATWSATTVRDSIRHAYANWDPPLEFVVLMGDPGAAWGIPVDGANYDHTYALGNWGPTADDIEDIGVGRLCGGTGVALATINSKIMAYEREPHMTNATGGADTSWFHHAFLYAGIGNSCASNWLLMRWAKDQFEHHTGVDSAWVLTHNGNVNDGDITTAFSRGIGFFLWRGSWEFQLDNIGGTTNPAGRFPIMMAVTCVAGDYTGNGVNSPTEDFLVAGTAANPKGAVAAIGTSTAGTHNPCNVTLAAGMVYNIADIQVEHLGTAVAGAKAMMYYTYIPDQPNNFPNLFTRYFNLLGDPSLSMWTDVPKLMNASYPETLSVGTRQMELTVTRASDTTALADAVVCLWKKGTDSTWVVGTTDQEGHVTLPVNVRGTGDMLVTVTKRGWKPILGGITFNESDVVPALGTYALDDDGLGGTSGNNNGVMNPGETIDLPVYVKNFGISTNATNITATLTSANPRVTVVNATTSFTDLAPGDSALGAVPFRIEVAADMQNWELAPLTLTVTSSETATNSEIALTCVAQSLEYVRHSFLTTFGPGVTSNLRVVLRNKGSLDMADVTGTLTSLSQFVTVETPTATFGTIAANTLDSNSTNFSLSARALTMRGHQAPMRLVLTNTAGLVDTVMFTALVGAATSTDPTGPDAYGYYAYDNSDTSYTDSQFVMCPTYNYVNISTAGGGGTNLTLNDGGEKTSPTPVYSTARAIGFGFKFYGQVYDTITICSNGWCAFGNQAYMDLYRNHQIPGPQAPEAMIAPYFDDLATSGTNKGVWIKQDADSHRCIIQWKASGWGGASFSTALDFEVILYDTTFYPTRDGNGRVLIQYNTVTMGLAGEYYDESAGCTVGIQAPGSTVGLQYAYNTTYSPGAATISSGRAILFTTANRELNGAIEGHVIDAGTQAGLAGALVSVEGFDFEATTDVQGYYRIPAIFIGTYNLRATLRRFNADSLMSLTVEQDSTETANFTLHHPEMSLSEASLEDTCGSTPMDTSFNIVNAGNGPLDYDIAVRYAGMLSANPWDSVGSVALTNLTQDFDLRGCEFAFDRWWITGSSTTSGHRVLHELDYHGNAIGDVELASTSANDWFDLAFDGQLIWGSQDHNIVGVDTLGNIVRTTPSPFNPSRALAFDPDSRHFFIADYATMIKEIDTTGAVIQTIANPGLTITGLAWDPVDTSGYNLYVFSMDGTSSQTRVTRINPVNRQSRLCADLHGAAGDRAAGCTITPGWNSVLLVFAGIIRNDAGARMQMNEMAFNTTWIDVNPAVSVVTPGSSQRVAVHFDPTLLRPDDYRVDLHIRSVIYDTTMILPIRLTRTTAVDPDRTLKTPLRYALYQNYPNPFNPTTQIRYDLKNPGMTRLAVYNLLGEKVTELVNANQPAGSYTVSFDGNDLASGVYFYRLESAGFVQVHKMMLMK
jgi:hypothetical protein